MKILLVNPNNIGDVVLSTPILDALHILYPGCEITCVVKNRCKSIISSDMRISRVHGFDFYYACSRDQEQQGFFDAVSVPWKKQPFDLAVVTLADIRANMMIRSWVGLAPFWGLVDRANQYNGSKAKLRSGSFLLSKPVYNNNPNIHQVDRLWLTVKAMDRGRLLPEKPFLPKLALSPLDPELFPQKPYMIVHPGANIPEKMWPIEKMAQVVEELKPLFSSVVVVGSADERQHGEKLASLSGCVDNRCGTMSLDTLASFISGSSLYLGNDTGPTHMAAALGVPVVSILDSREQSIRWGPYRPNDITATSVWHESDLESRASGSLREIWPRATVSEVLQACLSVLRYKFI